MPKQPNILLFLPDAVQAGILTHGHPCQAPNFARVAGAGLRFSRAYTPLPTCSPARASLMTGLLPHNHGVLQVEHCVDDDQSVLRLDKRHWAQCLAAAGYQTGYFGKWHIERSDRLADFGWQTDAGWKSPAYLAAAAQLPRLDDSNLIPGLVRYQEAAPGYRQHLHHGVTTLSVAEREVSLPVNLALPFLDAAAAAGRPWACCVSFADPNEALVCSEETYRRYAAAELPLPASLHDELAGRPAVYRRYQKAWDGFSDDDWRRATACYYARVTEVDMQLGRLLANLEKNRMLDDTVIIIATDHGRYLGAHGMDGHNFGAFEEIYNIPLVLSGPGIAAGAVTAARVGLHDLCPTILELAGVETGAVPDSRSFAPVLADPQANSDAFSTGFAEYHGSRYNLTQRVCWDGDWKLVFNGFDFDELYNLAVDPAELTNLINDPRQAGRIRAMMGKMWEKIVGTNDKPLATSHYYSLQLAAVGPDFKD